MRFFQRACSVWRGLVAPQKKKQKIRQIRPLLGCFSVQGRFSFARVNCLNLKALTRRSRSCVLPLSPQACAEAWSALTHLQCHGRGAGELRGDPRRAAETPRPGFGQAGLMSWTCACGQSGAGAELERSWSGVKAEPSGAGAEPAECGPVLHIHTDI